ncbi:sensor histidine kinase [Paenibacillus sp. MMS20-IR301]|uniref:sensor histidine kinase n=1 Tax=Paenibacillus sp. MMS20-IR301 TaxID=2895946 RepID=UPI0028EEA5DC|nr:sensor histidine kinase [Paenibacillus sp. MMS20-IR301]WNS44273.1 sensor histidine kinase [Paenibacillus sp. MMS20-IR301]
MKLFIREQSPIIAVYLAQLVIITLVYRLDGGSSVTVSLYAVLLSTILLLGYLAYRYLANRSFYERLMTVPGTLEESGGPQQNTPLAESLRLLLARQFRLYQNDLHNYRHKLEEHIHFINQWVHGMKTPLSVIHLMIQDKDGPPYTAIGDELDRLKKGLETVLYTARLDTFEHDFYVERLELAAVVRGVTSEQKRLFIRKRVFPQISVESGIIITTDEKWLSFVLTQLITNALRYTVEEGRFVHFRGCLQEQGRVVLEVRDEGVGIPPGDLPRVFDPYFTGVNGRSFQESTGMGLYLVKQICGKLEHEVEIHSEVGKGTTVRIIF